MEADFQASIYQTLRQLTSMDERECGHYVIIKTVECGHLFRSTSKRQTHELPVQ
jgi:hypothetical protein